MKWLSAPRIAAVLALILLLFIPALWTRAKPPLVRVAEVRRGTLVIRVSTNGTVEPIDDHEVRARLDARVLEIPDPGASIRKDMVLVRFDAGPVASELEAARAERLSTLESLRAARSGLDAARRRFDTDDDLHAKAALTTEKWRESRLVLEEAKANAQFLEKDVPVRIRALDLRIQGLEEQKSGSAITAADDGTVYRTEVKKGEMVRIGNPVLRYADLSRLRVRTNVDQVDLGKVREDQDVRVLSNAYPGREWMARITEIIPNVTMKENRSVAEALAEITSAVEGLLPGMTVDAEIIAEQKRDALQVPAEAVFDTGRGQFVYKLSRKKVHKAPVQVGLASPTTAEITAGLEPGETVVLGPVPGIADGMRVEVQKEDDQRS